MKFTLNQYSTNKKTTLVFENVQFGMIPKFFIVFAITLFSVINTFGQPYYPVYVENKVVKQNSYIGMVADPTHPPSFNEAKKKLPQPIWHARQDVINCYWKAWDIAFSNLKPINKDNGFVSPYIDPAFNDNIFMWDCSFMTMFGKYGIKAFNFQHTLNNFYAKQHADGFICREIRESNGTDCFERFDTSSTGPNIMPWAEWEYFLNFNDTARLEKIFPALLAYYQWFETYRTWPDGTYYSSGWGCGMDNQPRMPANYNPELSHGHMSWIDTSLQEIFVGNILIKMAEVLNRTVEVTEIANEITALKTHINNSMWDDSKSFYFDRWRDGTLSGVKSVAAYWALLAEAVPAEKSDKFIKHLENPLEFARMHRVATLSADNPDFNPDGGYWRGAVWAPTTYMVLRGLTTYRKDSLAYEIALNHLDNVVKVYNQTGTLWENYAPDKIQGNNRGNFVGWTGLVPINILFEYVFGIRANVPENTLLIDVSLTDEYGIKQYPYGENGLLDIVCKKRSKTTEKPSISIRSNVPLKVIVRWKNGELIKEIKAGTTNL